MRETLPRERQTQPARGVADPFVRDHGLDLPRKILVVDDSSTIRANIRRALRTEFTLIEAKNSEEAWNHLLADKGIELVITDLDMPGVDGYGLIKRIRSSDNPRIANTPVIVLTGLEDTVAKQKAFDEGANDFVCKTTDKIELRARVRAHQRLAQMLRELDESRRILRQQAYTDPLTGLINRRAFFENAEKSLSLVRRHREEFSVVMIDIDRFKRINDNYGHQAGDYVLVEVSNILLSMVRAEDILARIGGEEFALALPRTSALAAVVLAERLRRAIKEAKFVYGEHVLPVTISQGVATLDHDLDQDLDQLIAQADRRLYVAKQLGRDRVCSTDRCETPDAQSPALRLQEVLQMLERTRTAEGLDGCLDELLEAVLPLFERGNVLTEGAFDVARLREGIAVLRRAPKDGAGGKP